MLNVEVEHPSDSRTLLCLKLLPTQMMMSSFTVLRNQILFSEQPVTRILDLPLRDQRTWEVILQYCDCT